MLTTFINVKQEYFTFNKNIVQAAKEMLILEEAVLTTDDESNYDYYIQSYNNFNDLLKKLIGIELNNLIVWRLEGDGVQIYVMDYMDDGNIYQVLHFPSNEELEEVGKESLIGSPLEITTFDEFAEEATDEDMREVFSPAFPSITLDITSDRTEVTD